MGGLRKSPVYCDLNHVDGLSGRWFRFKNRCIVPIAAISHSGQSNSFLTIIVGIQN